MSTPNTKRAQLPQTATADAVRASSDSRVLGWAATVATFLSLLLFIGADMLRKSWFPPPLPLPHNGFPWEITQHLSNKIIISATWAAALLAFLGVLGAMIALRRGMPVPWRTLIVGSVIAVAVLTVLPPVGSTDALDYAVYGHIVALGKSPYVFTPFQYRNLMHLRFSVPVDWVHSPSVYGPLATFQEFLMAKIAGISLARTVFWLKLFNAVVYGAIAYTADRIFRHDRSNRIRAHLLWTANPLIIWSTIAGGHNDVLAAAIGVAGLLMVDRWVTGRPLVRALLAGVCVGAAADIKIDYMLFALALAWALRHRLRELLAAAAGVILVLVPSYAVAGVPAIKALADRGTMGFGYGFYGFFLHHIGIKLGEATTVAEIIILPVILLVLLRIPAGFQQSSAVRAGVAVSLGALLVWPHQFAWYSVMIICALIFYPASRIDWLALSWLGVVTFSDVPGLGGNADKHVAHWITDIQYQNLTHVMPLVMLIGFVSLIVMCFNGKWHPART
jgi:hypothetical protein